MGSNPTGRTFVAVLKVSYLKLKKSNTEAGRAAVRSSESMIAVLSHPLHNLIIAARNADTAFK